MFSRRVVRIAIGLLAGLAFVSGPQTLHAQQPRCASVMDVLTGSSNFATTTEAFKTAGLDQTLATHAGPFTVFAPNQGAFKQIPPWQLNLALHDKKMISGTVKYHILTGAALTSAQLQQIRLLPTLNGKLLPVTVKNGAIVLDGKARVLDAGTACANGIVYEIDTVLRP